MPLEFMALSVALPLLFSRPAPRAAACFWAPFHFLRPEQLPCATSVPGHGHDVCNSYPNPADLVRKHLCQRLSAADTSSRGKDPGAASVAVLDWVGALGVARR